MADNGYLYGPPTICVLNLKVGRSLGKSIAKRYCAIGDVPAKVRKAVNTLDRKVLSEWYGSRWKEILGVGKTSADITNVIGGALTDEINMSDIESLLAKSVNEFAYLDESETERKARKRRELSQKTTNLVNTTPLTNLVPALVGDAAKGKKAKMKLTVGDVADTVSEDAPQHLNTPIDYISYPCFYPEDRLSEVKEKIYILTEIPPYRQHLFYFQNNRAVSTYNIYADGPFACDIRDAVVDSPDNVLGIPIDRRLHALRGAYRVEALDSFKLLSGVAARSPTIFVADIRSLTRPIASQLASIVNDKYTFDLLYYGFVLKYFPQLVSECFHDFIVDETDLPHKYPTLARPRIALNSIYQNEADIVNKHYASIARATSVMTPHLNIAITMMMGWVENPRVYINIRNLFDKIRASETIAEVHAYVEHNSRRYLLRKVYNNITTDIIFPTGVVMKSGCTIAVHIGGSKFMFLNIQINGKYYIKCSWEEESGIDFDANIAMIKKHIDPIIAAINTLGRNVFIKGTSLAMPEKSNINYQGMTICLFWKRVMLSPGFKVFKLKLDAYIRAGIIQHRNVQQYDKYELVWKKGVYDFDITNIDRIISATGHATIANLYSYMSNALVGQKWNQHYEGRIMKITHRTTDIRMEVNDIHQDEFLVLYNYMLTYLLHLQKDPAFVEALNSREYTNVKKLRKLREEDPELYNLKKHGSKKVYSILCQNQRQPLIYTPDEVGDMSPGEMKKLTKYWNFTLNKPAYYGCPNKKYPHLSFIVGMHPKGYCLPCCNIKPTDDIDSKKSIIKAMCLRDHTFDKLEELGSKHVMAYGKDVDIGRVSKLPQMMNEMLYTTQTYFLYGVPQITPGLSHSGLLHSIAFAMSMEVVDVLNAFCKQLTDVVFSRLLSGNIIEYFATPAMLIKNLKSLLDEGISEGLRFTQYNALFVELTKVAFNTTVVIFIDTGSENINMSIDNVVSSDGSYIAVVKRKNTCYPVIMVDQEEYFRTNIISAKLFDADSHFSAVINGFFASTNTNSAISLPRYSLLTELFSNLRPILNRHNEVYAVMVVYEGATAYIPVANEVISSESVRASESVHEGVSADPKQPTNYNDLIAIITKINEHIHKKYQITPSVYKYREYVVSAKIAVECSDKYYGVKFTNGLISYFNAEIHINDETPVIYTVVNYADVNAAIMARTPGSNDNRKTGISRAMYNTYFYQLLMVEFTNYLDNERNVPLRDSINALIEETNFRSDMLGFHTSISKILRDFPSDINTLMSQIAVFYNTHFNKIKLMSAISSTVYEFDKITINSLRKLPHNEIVKKLKVVISAFTTTGNPSGEFPNVFTPCSQAITAFDPEDTLSGYCKNGKLIVDNIDPYIDVLAADIKNTYKIQFLLNSLYRDNSADFFKFIKREGESVVIFKL